MQPGITSGSAGEMDLLLRGKLESLVAWTEQWSARRFWLHVGVILLGAGLYGAAMGCWRDPQQALYVAIKFPLIILLTVIGNALLNGMLAPLLGLNIPVPPIVLRDFDELCDCRRRFSARSVRCMAFVDLECAADFADDNCG